MIYRDGIYYICVCVCVCVIGYHNLFFPELLRMVLKPFVSKKTMCEKTKDFDVDLTTKGIGQAERLNDVFKTEGVWGEDGKQKTFYDFLIGGFKSDDIAHVSSPMRRAIHTGALAFPQAKHGSDK